MVTLFILTSHPGTGNQVYYITQQGVVCNRYFVYSSGTLKKLAGLGRFFVTQ